MPPDDAVVIDRAAGDDLDRVVDLWVDLATEQQTHGSHLLPEANRSRMRATLAAHQTNDGLYVARTADRIVGFVSCSIEHGTLALDADRGLVSNLYVVPEHRGEGIGSELLAAAEEALAERGVSVVTLESMADNEAARQFYRQHGYESTRTTLERGLEE